MRLYALRIDPKQKSNSRLYRQFLAHLHLLHIWWCKAIIEKEKMIWKKKNTHTANLNGMLSKSRVLAHRRHSTTHFNSFQYSYSTLLNTLYFLCIWNISREYSNYLCGDSFSFAATGFSKLESQQHLHVVACLFDWRRTSFRGEVQSIFPFIQDNFRANWLRIIFYL